MDSSLLNKIRHKTCQCKQAQAHTRTLVPLSRVFFPSSPVALGVAKERATCGADSRKGSGAELVRFACSRAQKRCVLVVSAVKESFLFRFHHGWKDSEMDGGNRARVWYVGNCAQQQQPPPWEMRRDVGTLELLIATKTMKRPWPVGELLKGHAPQFVATLCRAYDTMQLAVHGGKTVQS